VRVFGCVYVCVRARLPAIAFLFISNFCYQ